MVDKTNSDMRYKRNRIRLEVMPALEKINPSITAAIGRLSLNAEEYAKMIGRRADAVPLAKEPGGAGVDAALPFAA